jgi:hypothetical protein
LKNRRAQQLLPGEKASTSGRGERTEKGSRRVKKCVQMYVTAKMLHVVTIPGTGGGGNKGKWWSG